MSDIFISYQRDDRDKAKELSERLIRHGYSTWTDIDLLPGENWAEAISEVIDKSKIVIVLWSQKSVQSKWVLSEATRGFNEDKLIPIRLDSTDIPMPFDRLQTEDFTKLVPTESASVSNSLLRSISSLMGFDEIEPNRDEAAARKEVAQTLTEVDEFKIISSHANQSFEEYASYLEKYGEETALFAEYAKRRMENLKPKAKEKLWKIIGGVGILAGLIWTLIQIGDYFIPQNQEPKSKPKIESSEAEDSPSPPSIADRGSTQEVDKSKELRKGEVSFELLPGSDQRYFTNDDALEAASQTEPHIFCGSSRIPNSNVVFEIENSTNETDSGLRSCGAVIRSQGVNTLANPVFMEKNTSYNHGPITILLSDRNGERGVFNEVIVYSVAGADDRSRNELKCYDRDNTILAKKEFSGGDSPRCNVEGIASFSVKPSGAVWLTGFLIR